MGPLALAALDLVGSLLAADDFDLAKKVIGRIVRIAGGSGTEAQRSDALQGYLEGMARDRASSATTLAMKRKRNGL